MNRERLLDAFSELDGKTVRSAAALLGYEEEAMKRKRIKPILRAALIAAVIGALMIAASPFIPLLYEVGEDVRALTSRLLVIAGLSLPIHSFVHAGPHSEGGGGPGGP